MCLFSFDNFKGHFGKIQIFDKLQMILEKKLSHFLNAIEPIKKKDWLND